MSSCSFRSGPLGRGQRDQLSGRGLGQWLGGPLQIGPLPLESPGAQQDRNADPSHSANDQRRRESASRPEGSSGRPAGPRQRTPQRPRPLFYLRLHPGAPPATDHGLSRLESRDQPRSKPRPFVQTQQPCFWAPPQAQRLPPERPVLHFCAITPPLQPNRPLLHLSHPSPRPVPLTPAPQAHGLLPERLHTGAPLRPRTLRYGPPHSNRVRADPHPQRHLCYHHQRQLTPDILLPLSCSLPFTTCALSPINYCLTYRPPFKHNQQMFLFLTHFHLMTVFKVWLYGTCG